MRNNPFTEKRKQLGISSILVVILVFLAFTPFIVKKYHTIRNPQEEKLDEHQPKNTIEVELGKQFKLTLGDTAHLKDGDTDIYLEVTEFINTGCPEDVVCIWSGYGVSYKLTVGDKVYENYVGHPLVSPYYVNRISTDYESYAEYILEKAETRCMRSGEPLCWRNLAQILKDPSYCEHIPTNLPDSDSCYQEVAEVL
jgi:hypothetical protein